MASLQRHWLCLFGLSLVAQGRVLAAEGQPELAAFDFEPKSIVNNGGDAITTVTFRSGTDKLAYIEVSFTDPSGVFRCSGSTAVEDAKTASGSIRLEFQRFMPSAMWTVASVLLM